MEIEAFSEVLSKIETKLQGEVIWTHVHMIVQHVFMYWSRVEHTGFSEIDRIDRNN